MTTSMERMGVMLAALAICACSSDVRVNDDRAGGAADRQPSDGRLVAVGAVGLIAVSDDGLEWERAWSDDADRFLDGVAYARGRWVVVGDGLSVTSSDSASWTAHEGFPLEAFDLSHDGESFLAAGREREPDSSRHAAVVRSTDGVAWSPHSSLDVDDSLFLSLVASGDRLVSVVWGTPGDDGARPSALFTYHNGFGWQRTSEWLPASAGHWDKVDHGAGRFVAVGDRIAATSVDGDSWVLAAPSSHLTALAVVEDGWIAMSLGGSARSTDGLEWTNMPIEGLDAPPEWQFAFEDVITLSDRIVAVGGPDAYNGVTFDGLEWDVGFGPGHGTLAEVAFGAR